VRFVLSQEAEAALVAPQPLDLGSGEGASENGAGEDGERRPGATRSSPQALESLRKQKSAEIAEKWAVIEKERQTEWVPSLTDAIAGDLFAVQFDRDYW